MSDPPPDIAAADEHATLQTQLERGDEAGSAAAAARPSIADPVALLRHLEVSGRFHRDGRLGRLYHRGQISLRENVSTNSLHVAIDGNHVMAHIDSVSPLAEGAGGESRYSVRQAVAHNIAGMVQDLVWLLRGRQGDHRCELDCEWVPARSAAGEPRLLDPRESPWSVYLEARVAGRLAGERLRAALAAVLGAGSMERDPLEVVECADDGALDAARTRLHALPVPAGSLPPLHVVLARRPGGDILMLNLNHAAADGFGAVAVLQAIARAYAGGGDPGEPLDFPGVVDLPVRPATTRTSIALRSSARVLEWLRNLRDRPVRLAADEPGDEPGYGVHLVGLSAEETGRLIEVDNARNSTNVLMAALHLAIAEWGLQHGVAGGRVGVLVAADLRPPSWRSTTIANLTVNARLSTRRRERIDAASTLEAISAQIARNKRTRTGVALIDGLERAGLLALWARQSTVVLQPLTGNYGVDTTVFCNVGSLEAPWFGEDAGETTELWFSTPARAPLSLCLGAATIAGRLHLTFRYPHRLLGPDAARRFAECYVDHLRAVADVA